MDWRFLCSFWRSFRLALQKWVLAAVRTGARIRDNLLPFRRLVLFFLAGALLLSVLVWGFSRRITVNKPVPLRLEREDLYSEDIFAGDMPSRASEDERAPGRARAPEGADLAEEKSMGGTVDLFRMQEEITELRHRVKELAEEKEKAAWEGTAVPAFGRPVQGRLLRSTGWHRYGNEWRYHTGVDLSLPAGRNVMAAAPGKVREIRTDPLLGWVVVIDHNAGWSSL